MEHIGKYIKVAKSKKGEVHSLMKKLGGILKRKGIQTVERYLEKIPRRTKKQIEEYCKLRIYINNNRSKMNYPDYILNKYLIGSGAIESAHRTVLQKRMKLSGQRWSINGLSNMIKLRSASMSGYWNKIQNIIRNSA